MWDVSGNPQDLFQFCSVGEPKRGIQVAQSIRTLGLSLICIRMQAFDSVRVYQRLTNFPDIEHYDYVPQARPHGGR